MLVVAVVSLVVVPLAQLIAERMTFAQLPQEFRDSVILRTQPPPMFGRDPNDPGGGDTSEHSPGPGPMASDADRDGAEVSGLREENQRLFTLFGDLRAMQRRAGFIGVTLALVLCTALALWISRTIARPLEAVSRASSEVARGELSTRVAPLGPWQPYETHALANGFNAMAISLERLEGERRAMIADIAHELRTPLAAMSMRLEALEDGLVPFESAEIELLQGHIRLLSRLIDDLRLLSLADAGRLTLDLEEIDLVPWLKQTVRANEDTVREPGVRLRLSIEATRATVTADGQRLRQVLQNLIDNAAKATPNGGTIEVALNVDATRAIVSVRDEGPGIPEEELDTIFQRFVQGRRRDTGVQGSGLGLAIVRTLVTLHGGEVTAGNRVTVPHGAEFLVTLPLSRDSS